MTDLRSELTRCPGVILGAMLVACSDSTGGSVQQPETNLNFLRPAPSAPSLASRSVSFWAVKGQQREATLYYAPLPGESDSSEFVRFRVRDRSLDRRPDGTPISAGDSILITISVTDPSRLIIDCQPSGLIFSANDPADMKIDYEEADDDIDGDDDVDAADLALRPQLAIWRQETPGASWTKVPSTSASSVDEVEADIFGFTRYAIAY